MKRERRFDGGIFYVRDAVSKQVLAGVGAKSRSGARPNLIWTNMNNIEYAKRFSSSENARRLIDDYCLDGAYVMDDHGMRVSS